MSKSYFVTCPRCGTKAYEQLITHGHCLECLYSNDFSEQSYRDFLTLSEVEELTDQAELFLKKTVLKKVKEPV